MNIREIFAEKIAEENLRIAERKEREEKQKIKLEQALKTAKEEIVNIVSSAQSSNFAVLPESFPLLALRPVKLPSKECFAQEYLVCIGCTRNLEKPDYLNPVGSIKITLDYLFSFTKIDFSKLFEEEKATFRILEDEEHITYLFIFN